MKRSREEGDYTSQARSYLNKVKDGLKDDNKYPMFRSIMADFKHKRVDIAGVTARVNEVLRGHEDLIMGFNDFLPKKHRIVHNPKHQEAVDFTEKIRLHFHDKEYFYNAFLDALKLYKEGKRDMQDLYYEAGYLFKEHDDLFQEFGALLSVDAFGVDKQEEKAWDKKYKRGLDLCGKVESKLGNSYDYLTFLKSLHLYTTKVIGSSELQVLVANLLPQDSGLMDEFNSFLNYCENIDGSSVASDGSGSSSSEENTGKHQEMLFQCEDIRFVRDLLLHSVSSATMQADESVSRIKDSNSITLETPVEVKEHFTCLNSRCIERLCGPALTLPVILSRLMQKREDLTRLMTEFNELWAQVNAKNPKENSKRLITKSLKRRIRRIEERMQTEHDIFLVGNGK